MTLAFVSPRLHEPGTVGGAETLLYSLALDAVRLGHLTAGGPLSIRSFIAYLLP